MAHDVFICYSSKDKTTADAVCAVLESEGIRCWIAPRDILVGMSYGEAIVNAIHNAKALVLVFSGHANQSPQIEREVERAINQRIPVIPLRIEDVAPDKALEYFLSTPHWLDAFTPPLERHLKNLAAQIHRLIVTGSKADELAAKAAAALVSTDISSGISAGPSPFKTVQVPPPPPESKADTAKTGAATPDAAKSDTAKTEPPKPEPVIAAGAMGGAAGAGASSTLGSASIIPPSTTGPRVTSPIAVFKGLDNSAKVGIGAALLVLIIGIGWALSSGSGGPAVGPIASQPITTTDGKSPVPSPDGTRIGETPTPQVPPVTGNTPSNPGMPSDGNVIPGREGPAPSPEMPPPPQAPDTDSTPSSPDLPSDGDVIPGRGN